MILIWMPFHLYIDQDSICINIQSILHFNAQVFHLGLPKLIKNFVKNPLWSLMVFLLYLEFCLSNWNEIWTYVFPSTCTSHPCAYKVALWRISRNCDSLMFNILICFDFMSVSPMPCLASLWIFNSFGPFLPPLKQLIHNFLIALPKLGFFKSFLMFLNPN